MVDTDKKSGGDEAAGTLGDFLSHVLDQLLPSAWLPGALLTTSIAFLVQFAGQCNKQSCSIDPLGAANAFAESPPSLFLVVPALLISVTITQAFSFPAMELLQEGNRSYGRLGWIRRKSVRRHTERLNNCRSRRLALTESLLDPRWERDALNSQLSQNAVATLRRDASEAPYDRRSLPLCEKDELLLPRLTWRTFCKDEDLVLIDHLQGLENTYPQRDLLPTRLGNLIRATTDTLSGINDPTDFVLLNVHLVPKRLALQLEQFRTRLEMYCIFVFVGALLAFFSWLLLLPGLPIVQVLGVSLVFAIAAIGSYAAAFYTAKGYCSSLKVVHSACAKAIDVQSD